MTYKKRWFQAIGVLFLAWLFLYTPEVKLDLSHTHITKGVLSYKDSSRYSRDQLNGKDLECIQPASWPGCDSKLMNSDVLMDLRKNKTPVEVVFAPDVGNSLEAIFFHRSFVIEIRLNGTPIEPYTQKEMLNRLYEFNWVQFLFSMFMFLIFVPYFFNLSFYSNLFRR